MSSDKDQHNQGGMIAFIISMGGVTLFMIYIAFFHQGVVLDQKIVDPRNQPAVAAVKEINLASIAEPWVASDELVAHGKKLFKANCTMCHGNEGKGDGPAGMGLNPKPRNLIEGVWKMGAGSIAHFKVLQTGIAGSSMASFSQLSSAERWTLIHFIQSITQNKGNDNPKEIADFAKTAK